MTWRDMWANRGYRAHAMPAQFHKLAEYNTNRRKGILYDPETTERMRLLQADFDTWITEDRARR